MPNTQRSRQKGCSIEVIPNSNTGEVDVSLLTASLKRGGVAAVVISHMPHHQGTINPAEEVNMIAMLHISPFAASRSSVFYLMSSNTLNWMGGHHFIGQVCPAALAILVSF